MIVHYTDAYLMSPPHKVTVDLIGLGGTGSQVLNNIARLNVALISLGHPGLHLRCWDDDEVTDANVGRQLFSPADIGYKKSVVLTSRVNQFFGFEWEAKATRFKPGKIFSNLTITCVDTAAARIEIGKQLQQTVGFSAPFDRAIYWLDLGNTQKTGQAIMGTIAKVKQPKSDYVTNGTLPTVIKKFPQIKKIKESDQGPSCSLAEALKKQDLYINSTLAQFGCNLIWKLFREGMIRHHGCFVNLDTLIVNPIKI